MNTSDYETNFIKGTSREAVEQPFEGGMKILMYSTISMLLISVFRLSALADKVELKLLPNEYWWAGLSAIGHEMPYDASSQVSYDMWGDNRGNQAQPLLLSSEGRYVWSEEPVTYAFDNGTLTVTTREGKMNPVDANLSNKERLPASPFEIALK